MTSIATSIAGNIDFKGYISALNSRHTIPGRTTVSKNILQLYAQAKAVIKNRLVTAHSKKTVTADIWSKKGFASSYLGITIHYVSAEYRLESAVLDLIYFPPPHTGDAIGQIIKKILSDWQIESDCPIIITDSGSSMIKAFKAVKNSYDENLLQKTIDDVASGPVSLTNSLPTPAPAELESGENADRVDSETRFQEQETIEDDEIEDDPPESVPVYNDAEELMDATVIDAEELDFVEEGRIVADTISRNSAPSIRMKRISCLSHTLQLVMGGFDKYMNSKDRSDSPLFMLAIASAKKLVGKFNKSTKATSRLIEICGKKLVPDCSTRWSSTYLLIHRLLQLRVPVTKVCEELEWNGVTITEWNLLSRIESLLEPFASYTQLVSADQTPTFSAVVPTVTELNMHLKEVINYYLIV